MLKADMSEKQTGVVSIDDIQSPAFSILMKFMYSGEVDESWYSCGDEVIYAADKVRERLTMELFSSYTRID